MKWLLAAHFIAFAMGVGMSFSNLVNIRLAMRHGGERAAGLALLRGALGRIGDWVIAAIWITGIGVLLPLLGDHGLAAMGSLPVSFHIKLFFAATLTISHAGARITASRIARTGNTGLIRVVQTFTLGVFLSALLAIVLAVAAFG